MEAPTPADRARAVAAALIAEANPVSSRVLRERARVSNAVAVQVAREVNAQQADAEETRVPSELAGQLDALWRSALVIARTEQADVLAAATDRVEQAEADLAGSRDRVAELETELVAARTALAEAQRRAQDAEGVAAALRDALAMLKPAGEQ